jgi:hypothetical protein
VEAVVVAVQLGQLATLPKAALVVFMAAAVVVVGSV